MNFLPNAKLSPRVNNGVLYWYDGDMFDITFVFDMALNNGTPVNATSKDTIDIIFYDHCGDVVVEKTFTGSDIVDSGVTIKFDAATTALFPEGEYTYDIDYTSGKYKCSLVESNQIFVE